MAAGETGTEVQCSILEDVMGILGRAWAGAVVEAMLNGRERFSDIARAVPGVTDGVLSARLKELCARGLAERRVEPGPPVSVSYHLTDAGRDLVERATLALNTDVFRSPGVNAEDAAALVGVVARLRRNAGDFTDPRPTPDPL